MDTCEIHGWWEVDGQTSCPVCEITRLRAALTEAHRTITLQRMTPSMKEAEWDETMDELAALLELPDKIAEKHPVSPTYSDVVDAIKALKQRVGALERAVKWFDEFVVEPEWFPNEGDRQCWQEKRAALRGGEEHHGY